MSSQIFALCDEYVTRMAALDPIWGGMRGVVGDFHPATDFGPEGVAARAELIARSLRTLATLPVQADADAAAARFLAERLSAEHAWYEAGEPFRLLRAPFGLLTSVRDSVELLPRTDEAGWQAVRDRLSAVPAMLAGWRQSLRLGLDRGLPAARRQAVEAAAQADRYAGQEHGGPAFAGLLNGYAGAHRSAVAEAADRAHAAYAETARFLREEYAPRAAEADAVGRDRYTVACRLVLGADIDPVEAYEWGWAELRRIEAEISAEADAVRPGATPEEAAALLDESHSVVGAQRYREWLQDRHDEAVSRLDGTHFDLAPALRRVDVTLATGSAAGAAYYTPPSEDLTRPGRTWWPLGDRQRFAIWNELTTVYHEGVPGHHLQLGQVRVIGDRLSRFSRVQGVSGHSEGWALYAERLADELGWYVEPGRRLGMLTGSAVRAARVVIDVGLHLDLPLPDVEARRHGPRWTFEVAKDVLRTRGQAAAHRVHAEVVRYCGWPAQATAYKLGERAWLAARDDARRRLGPDFDLKRWHTEALSLGPIGIDGLAEALRRLG